MILRPCDASERADDESDYLFVVGNNSHGQLGLGHQRPVPTLQRLKVSMRVRKVACGWAHTALIVIGGDLYTWGANRWSAAARIASRVRTRHALTRTRTRARAHVAVCRRRKSFW